MSGSSKRSAFYTPTFRRALVWYAENGFFERDLDADDWAFIEKIREHGAVDCGTTSSGAAWGPPSYYAKDRQSVLPEELEYWTQPFSVEAGPAPRQIVVVKPLPKDVIERKAYLAKRRAEKEAAARELREARRQWDAEQRKLEKERLERIKRWGLEEREWVDFHNPNRFHEPEWKRQERKRRMEARKRLKQYRADKETWQRVYPKTPKKPPRPKAPPPPPPKPVYTVHRERDWWNWPELPPPPDQLFTSGNAVVVHIKDERMLLERYGMRLYFYQRRNGMACYVTRSGRDFQREIGV